MKIVIHTNWGSFKIPNKVIDELNLRGKVDRWDDSVEIRTNPIFIDYVERHPGEKYKVKNIPDNATDFRILEYDGCERVIAVVDGKIIDI